jgi:hypothetical protein
MNETCKTCPWFSPTHHTVKDRPHAGVCRINPPIADTTESLNYYYAAWPHVMDGTVDWCGKHPAPQAVPS